MPTVLARQGETVDQIAARCYGDTTMVAAILDANPGLAALGLRLPHGAKVTLPERVTPTVSPTLSLWD